MAPNLGHRYEPLSLPPSYAESESIQRHESLHLPELTVTSDSHSLLQSSPSRALEHRPPTVHTEADESDDASLTDGLFDYDQADLDVGSSCGGRLQEFDIQEPEPPVHASWHKRLCMPFRQWKWLGPLYQLRLPRGSPARSTDEPRAPLKWAFLKSHAHLIVLIARVIGLLLVLAFLYLLFSGGFLSTIARNVDGPGPAPDLVRQYLLGDVDPERLQLLVQHFTQYPHLAGTEGDYGMAMDVATMFRRAGLHDVSMDEVKVYLNYPIDHGRVVQILNPHSHATLWNADLEEDEFSDGTTPQTFAFHSHSRSGDVHGPLVYVNYGLPDDFKHLADLGISCTGAIALVRYGSPLSNNVGLKVKAAELAGFAGCLVYSDPADEGFKTSATSQSGPSLPPDSVRRGSVSLPNWVIGDVLTPGWESRRDLPRLSPNQTRGLVGIPSLPLAWRHAQILLQHLSGFGQLVPSEWVGSVPSVHEWWTGNQSSPIVRLRNDQDEVVQKSVWNVYGTIEGYEQGSKRIILGNQRDSLAFGATQPHGGTAVFIELARILGELSRHGWKPLRSIEFMSWDASAYNYVGSTEFVEHNVKELREDAIAYINVNSVLAGDELLLSGSPMFTNAMDRVLRRLLTEPTVNVSIVPQSWQDRGSAISPLDYAGDYVPFMNIAGTSSLDLKFAGVPYPSQSTYDNFEWVSEVGDPGWGFHKLMTQIVGLLILDLSDRHLLPLDLLSYANVLVQWTQQLETWSLELPSLQNVLNATTFSPLIEAAVAVRDAAVAVEGWSVDWQRVMLATSWYEADDVREQRLAYNNKLGSFETRLLDLDLDAVLPHRSQFRHVVFSPQQWSLVGDVTFASIREAISDGDLARAAHRINRTASLLRSAAEMLLT